jgi:hypothetical protein
LKAAANAQAAAASAAATAGLGDAEVKERLAEANKLVEQKENEAKRLQEELQRLLGLMTMAEEEKFAKDKQIASLQE